LSNEQTTSLQTIFSTITDCFSTSNNRQNTTQLVSLKG
jgi:hypothetical protein